MAGFMRAAFAGNKGASIIVGRREPREMNPSKKKSETEHEGDIRDERDPKPTATSEDVEETEEAEDKEGNLPPAMPPGV
jgi:hypothetical protein